MPKRPVLVLLLLVALQLGWAPRAVAHSVLVSSNPGDGQVLGRAPRTVDLGFSEAVDPAATSIRIVDAQQHVYAPAGIRARHDTHVVATLPHLPDETYRLSWRTVSADDRHETSGVIVFEVGAATTLNVPRPRDPAPDRTEAALRWLVLVFTGALVGGLVIAALERRTGPAARGAWGAAVLPVAEGSGVLAALTFPALTVIEQLNGSGRLSETVTSAFGLRSLVAEAALIVLVAVVERQRRAGRRVVTDVVAVTAVLALAVATALLGHAATSAARTALAASHLVAAYTWFGVVVVPVAALLVARRSTTGTVALHRSLPAVLLSFGPVATASVAWLVVSGILLTGDSASTVDALLTSVFGRVLAVKLGLALAAGLLGLHLHHRLRRAGARSVDLRALGAEALILVGVVAAAGTLLSTAPAQGLRWEPGTSISGTPTAAGEQAGLVESLTVSPNRPGRDFVTVDVFNTRRPAPAPITGVRVELSGPRGEHAALTADRRPDGAWTSPTDVVDRPGEWALTLLVSRPGLPTARSVHAWVVGGRIGGPANPVVSTARLAPIAGGLAAAVVGVILLMLGLRRRRDPRRPLPAGTVASPHAAPPAGKADRPRPVAAVGGGNPVNSEQHTQ